MKTLIHPSLRIVRPLAFTMMLFCVSTAFAYGVSGCSGARVYSDTAPNTAFRAYRTFALVEEPHRLPKQSRHSAEILETNIERSLEQEMQRRGYAIDEKQPDLLVKYSIDMDTDTKLVSQPVYRSRPTLAVGGFWRPRYYVTQTPVVVGSRTRAVTQKEGVLVIDVIDRASGKVIWHGWSEEPIQNKSELAFALGDNVRDIMNAYPVPAR